MKYTHIILLSCLTLLMVSCSNRNANNTSTTNLTENETKEISRAEALAGKTCDCLKPFAVLQKQFENQEIAPEEYADKLKKLAKPMQDCTNKLTEATEDKPDFKDEVLFRMKQICPIVAEIIVPAQ